MKICERKLATVFTYSYTGYKTKNWSLSLRQQQLAALMLTSRMLQLLLALLLCHMDRSVAIFTLEHCAAINANSSCACERDSIPFITIECPTPDPSNSTNNNTHAQYQPFTLSISIQRRNVVNIKCAGGHNENAQRQAALLQLLPHVPIGATSIVLIEDCPASAYADLLERLQLRLSNVLELRNSSARNTHDLTRAQLEPLTNVSSLKLSGYTRLADDLFADFARLQYLDVETSQLAPLCADMLLPLAQLKGLTLAGGLRQLPAGLFRAQRFMYSLLLSGNALHNLSRSDFVHVRQVRSLHLARNALSSLAADVFALLPSLLRLYLVENRLSALPPMLLAQQSLLKSFDVSVNRLRTLPSTLFAQTRALEELWLSQNQLETLDARMFAPLNYLKRLYLDQNHLRTLAPSIFAHNDHLVELHLEHNELRVPSAQQMCETFGHLSILSDLHLRNNSLQHLCPKLYEQRHNQLDMAHNRVDTLTLPLLVMLACTWTHVDLSWNALQQIEIPLKFSVGDQEQLNCASTLELNNNPLHCDCQLSGYVEGIHRRALTNATRLKDEQLRCASPPTLRGRCVVDLRPRELLCPMQARYCPSACKCWLRLSDDTLLVNCSHAQLHDMPALPLPAAFGLRAIELDLAYNNISALPALASDVVGYEHVTQLTVAGNRLALLAAPQLPPQLVYLDVRDNRLERLNDSFYALLNASQTLDTLLLSRNAWLCDCAAEQLLIAVKLHYRRIADIDELLCADAQYAPMLELAFSDICPEDLTLLLVGVTLLTTGFLLAIALALYYKFRMELKVWLYAHGMCLWCVTEAELDKDKSFDAFISYSHRDERYVTQELLPGLEHGCVPFRICTHERNWLAGAYIAEQIIESVEQSCRTIIVMSQHFIESAWSRMEFRTAHQCALDEGRARVIIIMYGELRDTSALDTELQAYLKMNTYLKWNDPNFWSKLRYAMPHWNHAKRRRNAKEGETIYVHNAMEMGAMTQRSRS